MPNSHYLELARERLSVYERLNRLYFTGFAVSCAIALPLVLLAAPGLWRVIGYTYLIIWALLVAISTGAIFALLFDALLIIRNRPPVMLPQMLFSRDVTRQQTDVRRATKSFHRIAGLAYWANPLANVTVALIVFSLRLRPAITAQIAVRIAEWQGDEKKIVIGGEPSVEYVSPAIDQAIGPVVDAPRDSQRELQFA